jgi:hypothetical protein
MGQVKTETGPSSSSHLHKGPALLFVAATLGWPQAGFQILWGGLACLGGPGGRQSVRRKRDYFFFLEVFFATFLVAAFAVFFAFFAFLAMSSSVEKIRSMNMRTP